MSIPKVVVSVSTDKSVKDVIDTAEKILKEKKITVFARISHSDAAKAVGLTMQDEELIIFGNPKVGTAIMMACPAIGIELPLKIIAWRDKSNKTIVAYQDLEQLAIAYGLIGDSTILVLREFMSKFVSTLVS